jgi:tetraacyldisaccharide 4'-kinase
VVRRLPELPQFDMQLVGQRFVAVAGARRVCDAASLMKRKLYAMAGIGDPQSLFPAVAALGLEFEEHPFPDHHSYAAADLALPRTACC